MTAVLERVQLNEVSDSQLVVKAADEVMELVKLHLNKRFESLLALKKNSKCSMEFKYGMICKFVDVMNYSRHEEVYQRGLEKQVTYEVWRRIPQYVLTQGINVFVPGNLRYVFDC